MNRHRWDPWILFFGVLWLGLCISPGVALPADPDRKPLHSLDEECEYGISLALGGDLSAAETVFVSLLSHAPGDARALNNLGNIALFRGRIEVALEFYSRAGRADSTDPGILLNQSTALLLAGDDESAVESAFLGLQAAGGPRPAAGLLGLVFEGDVAEWPKGEKKTYLSREEVLSLLNVAAGKVPADSLRVKPGSPAPGTSKARKKPTWRSGGPRAGEPDEAIAVYWKH